MANLLVSTFGNAKIAATQNHEHKRTASKVMAKWSDVVEAEKKIRIAVAERSETFKESALYRDFILENGHKDAFMEWFAKRIGVHKILYGTNGQISNGEQYD